MKSRIRVGSLLLALASAMVVVLAVSTPAQAIRATPLTQTGAGGCSAGAGAAT